MGNTLYIVILSKTGQVPDLDYTLDHLGESAVCTMVCFSLKPCTNDDETSKWRVFSRVPGVSSAKRES